MSTVSLNDAKQHLNISGSAQDGELQAMLDTAEAAIEMRCGPLGIVTVTERVHGNRAPLVLQQFPVVSLTSVTPVGGTAYDVSTFDLDVSAGTLAYVSGSSIGTGRYDVVYVAGRAELPDDLRMAVLELVRHFWETQRGPTRRPGSTVSDSASNTLPGAAYLFPFRVEQLLAPHTQVVVG